LLYCHAYVKGTRGLPFLNRSQEFRARSFFVTFDPFLSNGSDVIAENVRSMVPGELVTDASPSSRLSNLG